MKLKFKISGKKPQTYNGSQSLDIPKGTILYVEYCTNKDFMGSLIMRTDEDDTPFVDINDKSDNSRGYLWNSAIADDTIMREVEFELILEE